MIETHCAHIDRWNPQLVLYVVLMASFLLPTTALAQSADVEALIERGHAAGLDRATLQSVAERGEQRSLSPDAIRDIMTPVVETAESNLPAAPLLTKAMEGLAKNVPTRRMNAVLRTMHTHTQEAGRLVDAWLRTDAATDVLGQEASEQHRTALIRGVAAARQQELSLEAAETWLTGLPNMVSLRPIAASRIESALRILPQLPDASRSDGAGHRLAYAAVEAEYQPAQIRQLPQALEQAHRQSEKPLRTLARQAAGAMGTGRPAADVLNTLFRGEIPGGGPPSEVGPPEGRPTPPDTPPDRPDPPSNPPS